MTASIDDHALDRTIDEALNRWPAVGLAVGVVQDGSLAWFRGRGVADITSRAPVDEDTVFRIASITKTFTSIAVMQLWERGLIDLDAPAGDYLRSFALVPARARFRPATIRHLLTHTGGIRAVRSAADLLRPALGWSAPTGEAAPPLADYYRRGLRVDVEPGTRWAYSNHGFATLGQIVADVTGLPLDQYLRTHVFEPLGMERTELALFDQVRPRVASGYVVRSRGVEEVPERAMITVGASAVSSTSRDMARYVAALLHGGANAFGKVLEPETLATMFLPHHRPDPRVPGMGLGFFREEIGGHLLVGHDGIWHGFRTDMVLAPADGIGVLVMANTGAFNPGGAPVPLAHTVLRRLLDVPESAVRTDVADRPSTWNDFLGWYSFGPGALVDPQPRLLLGAGLEVVVRKGHLTLRGQMPVPAVRRGLRLHPDADDPDVFHLDLSPLGLGSSPVVFSREAGGEVTALHLGLQPMSLQKQPSIRNPRPWVTGALAGLAVGLGVRARRVGRAAAGGGPLSSARPTFTRKVL